MIYFVELCNEDTNLESMFQWFWLWTQHIFFRRDVYTKCIVLDHHLGAFIRGNYQQVIPEWLGSILKRAAFLLSRIYYKAVSTTIFDGGRQHKSKFRKLKWISENSCSHSTLWQTPSQSWSKTKQKILAYHFSSRLTATLNLCSIYLKLLVHVL